MNAPVLMPEATIDDLMRHEGKAELINGRIVSIMSPGGIPNIVGGEIFAGLRDWSRADPRRGRAYTDGMIFSAGRLRSGRQTFMPDAAYDPAPVPGMSALDHAPAFAVEVRSENDYGSTPDREYAAKRADYFEAGTLVVWDVDPLAKTIRCYRPADPLTPQLFVMGQDADAEPAVPGWRVRVDAVMWDPPPAPV